MISRIEPVFISWGQHALEAERTAFNKVCEILRVPSDQRHAYTVGFEWRNARSGADDKQPFPVARNLVLLAVASAAAATTYQGCEVIVVVGFTADDTAADAGRGFVNTFNETLREAVEANHDLERIAVVAPLWDLTKSQAITWAVGKRRDSLFAATWSCWIAGPNPCGACDACLKRKDAFAKAGLLDPALPPPER